jgi:DNA-binding CsgD family transcriptional regulator
MSYLPLSTTEEMKIVALIARGDTYAQIQEEMKAMGRTVTLQTIARA